MKKILVILAFLLLAAPAMAITHPDEKLRNPVMEARAVNLTEQLRCVTCQNESIEHSQADIARDLRILVRTQILAGKTDAQITQFLRERYGDYILLNPPVAPHTYALWFAPAIAFALGGIAIALTFKRRKRK